MLTVDEVLDIAVAVGWLDEYSGPQDWETAERFADGFVEYHAGALGSSIATYARAELAAWVHDDTQYAAYVPTIFRDYITYIVVRHPSTARVLTAASLCNVSQASLNGTIDGGVRTDDLLHLFYGHYLAITP